MLLTYGPLVLARDKSVDPGYDKPVTFSPGEIKDFEITADQFCIKVKECVFIPYYKAGASWDEKTEYRCWLKIKN